MVLQLLSTSELSLIRDLPFVALHTILLHSEVPGGILVLDFGRKTNVQLWFQAKKVFYSQIFISIELPFG